MAKVIAIGNNKGGIGKTTTAANLSTGLVRKGKRVLAIDNDPQGHLSKSLGVDKPVNLLYTLNNVMYNLIHDIDVNPADGLIKTAEGVDLMPTNLRYSGMELDLFSAMNREQILYRLSAHTGVADCKCFYFSRQYSYSGNPGGASGRWSSAIIPYYRNDKEKAKPIT